MAVAAVWAGIAAEPIKAQWLFSFLARRKGSHTCGLLDCSNYDTYTRHCRDFEICKILRWKEDNT
jgi:hypothetical protein